MTESRGTMTAQQFWDGQKYRFCPNCQAKAFDLADALSTHNTAELRAALEAKEKELAIHAEYAKKAFYEMSAILDLAGTEDIYKLTNRLNSFKEELLRLRSQGAPRSQCAPIGTEVKTWADYRKGCLDTYGGGHRDDGHLEAFRHGMETVFNLLEAEFPPAEVCKLARSQGAGQWEAKQIANRIVAHLALKHGEYVGQYWEEIVEIVEESHAPVEGARQWISVEERLPEMDGAAYLVICNNIADDQWDKDFFRDGRDLTTAQGQGAWYNFVKFGKGITHWQPLSSAPAGLASPPEGTE